MRRLLPALLAAILLAAGSPLFKVQHGPVVRMGVESTAVALKELMRKP